MRLTIKNRIMISFVALLTIPVILLAVLSTGQIFVLSDSNAKDSSKALKTEELTNLDRLANDQASYIEETFKQWSSEMTMLDNYTEAIFNNELQLGDHPSYYWTSTTVPGRGYYPAPYDLDTISFDYSTYFIPPSILDPLGDNPANLGVAAQQTVDKSAHMDNMFRSIHEANPSWVWLYAQYDLPGKVFRNYPFDDLSYFYDSSSEDYLPTGFFGEQWYKLAEDATGDQSIFVSPYIDPVAGLLMSITRPLRFPNGTLFGVVGGDVTIEEIKDSVLNTRVLDNGYSFLVDHNGNAISHPALEGESADLLDLEFQQEGEKTAFNSILTSIKGMETGRESFTKDGKTWWISYVPISVSGHSLALVVPESDIVAPANAIQATITQLTFLQVVLFLLVLLVVLGLIVAVGAVISGRIVRPIKELTSMVQFIAQGDLSRDLRSDQGGMEREIGVLHSVFDNLLTSLRFGNTDYYRGDLNRAYENYMKALELFETTNNRRGVAIAQNNLGNIFKAWGDFENARRYYHESIKTGEDQQDKRGLASRLNNLGLLHLEEKNYDAALDCLNQALRFDEELNNIKGISIRLGNIGLVYQRMGDWDRARSLYQKMIDSDERHNNRRGLGYGSLNLGSFYAEMDEFQQARSHLQKALKTAQEYEDVTLALNALGKLAFIHENMGDMRKAQQARSKTEEIKRRMANKKIVVFVIDYSGSMGGVRMNSAVSGALEILDTQVNPQDEVGVITFNTQATKIMPLTNMGQNSDAIRKSIRTLKYPTGMTAFYDALGKALEDLTQVKGNEQRWVIALTDGLDNSSERFTIYERRPNLLQKIFGYDDPSIQGFLKESLLNANLVIVGVGRELAKVEDDLRRLAEQSPRGKYIAIADSYNIGEAIQQAFREVTVLMAQVDVEGFNVDR